MSTATAVGTRITSLSLAQVSTVGIAALDHATDHGITVPWMQVAAHGAGGSVLLQPAFADGEKLAATFGFTERRDDPYNDGADVMTNISGDWGGVRVTVLFVTPVPAECGAVDEDDQGRRICHLAKGHLSWTSCRFVEVPR